MEQDGVIIWTLEKDEISQFACHLLSSFNPLTPSDYYIYHPL
jgi:hypothetical protein